MSEQISTTIKKLKDLFQQKYNEEIDEATLTKTIEEYGEDRVEEVITNMKDDAYKPVSFMNRSLRQGWYKSKKEENQSRGITSNHFAENTKATWNRMVSLDLCSQEDANYIIDAILGNIQGDENRIRDIHFRIRQGLYSHNPAAWFYWLKFPENRKAANQWIKDNGISDIPLYEI